MIFLYIFPLLRYTILVHGGRVKQNYARLAEAKRMPYMAHVLHFGGALDQNSLPPLRALLCSLMRPNPGEHFDLYATADGLTPEVFAPLPGLCAALGSAVHPLKANGAFFCRYLFLPRDVRPTAISPFCGKRRPWKPSYTGRFGALYKHSTPLSALYAAPHLFHRRKHHAA